MRAGCVEPARQQKAPARERQGGLEARAASLAFVPSSQSPGIAVLISNEGGCNRYYVCIIYSINSNMPVYPKPRPRARAPRDLPHS